MGKVDLVLKGEDWRTWKLSQTSFGELCRDGAPVTLSMARCNRNPSNPTSTSVTTALAGTGPAVRTTTPTESAALLLDVCGNLLLTEEDDQATAACFLEIEAVTSRVSAAVFQNAVRVRLHPRG